MENTNDLYIKIQPELFRLLVTGKEVVIEQPDGSNWHFLVEDMGHAHMIRCIADAWETSQLNH